MKMLIKWFYKILLGTLTLGLLFILLTVALVQWYFFPQLPSVEPLETADPQVSLKVYSKDNVLFAEFGEYYHLPIALNKIPPLMIKAVLVAEDSHFYQPFWREILRGGSPITRQLAHQFLPNCDKNDNCDFNEMLLALKIEQELTKDEILTLYLNKVFFGPCAYGAGAAAQLYYGKQIQALTLAQWAMLAGLTNIPSYRNPITNPQRALTHRNQILEQMLALQFISQEDYDLAVEAPNTAKLHQWLPKNPNLYIAEMVRDYMYTHYGEAAYTKGYKIITTIDSQWQTKAVSALRNGLFRYNEQQKYRGVLAHVDLPSIDGKPEMDIKKIANDILANYKIQVDLIPSLVWEVKEKQIVAYSQLIGQFEITVTDLVWDYSVKRDKRAFKRGDIILVRAVEEDKKKHLETIQRWHLSQIPKLEGALVSINPNDGAITALVGGFDFDCYRKPFNRVTQLRTAGSIFQPFVYSAALAHGLTPDSIIVDTHPKDWYPQSYNRQYYGRIRLRKMFLKSLQPVFVNLVKTIGVEPIFEHIAQFGFSFKYFRQPVFPIPVAGAVGINPLELATGYAVFANGGYLVKPYFIERIENPEGKVIYSANPLTVCRSCLAEPSTTKSPALDYAPQVITSDNAQQTNTILKEAIQIELKEINIQLKRNDFAGKSGSTDDGRNVWYAGYSPEKVTTVWVGFDNWHPFRYYSKHGKTIVLPIWAELMATLKGKEYPNK